MKHFRTILLALAVLGVASVAVRSQSADGLPVGPQSTTRPNGELPNPYTTNEGWYQMPAGRTMGRTSAVDSDSKGNIWIAERCGANSCAESTVDPILQFDASGKFIKGFGSGMFVAPHSITFDADDNFWVTDMQASNGKGLQVFKFNPDGKVLITLGTKGVAGEGPDTFAAPTDVAIAPNGDIFVTDGHTGCNCPNNRVVKFSKDGKFIKTWGKLGTAPGEMNMPHTLAIDSRGRLLVGDRTNNRIQIFDQNGTFVAEWKQFGRPSGIRIRNNILYVSDSESQNNPDKYGHNPGWPRGIWIGTLDGKITGFIPDPKPLGGASIAEGIGVDHRGNIYGAELANQTVKKYSPK